LFYKYLTVPLSKLCEWVTELVKVVNEVVEWICEKVIVGTFIELVERSFVYLLWIVRWVCWIIDWPLRFVDILFCLIGAKAQRQVDICVKILTDDDGTAAATRDHVMEILRRVEQLLKQCNVIICIRSIEFVRQADFESLPRYKAKFLIFNSKPD